MKCITAAALVPEPSAVEGDMAIGIAEIPAVLFPLVGKTVRSEKAFIYKLMHNRFALKEY
jgi:hypothetical protein